MSAGHHRPLVTTADSVLHALPAQCKVAATLLFVVAVVATPREALWAFAIYAIAVLGFARLGRLRWLALARRLTMEVPFLVFAVVLPFVGGGERVDVLGLSLSSSGLWSAWNIVVKGSLGLAATVVLVSTTALPDLLRGLERLRVPNAFTSVASFMLRYAEVVSGDLRAMRVARASRGYDPRWIWQAKAVASSAGALFIRSYERGERVYLAMLARGYTGQLTGLREDRASRAEWCAALALPLVAGTLAAAAWTFR